MDHLRLDPKEIKEMIATFLRAFVIGFIENTKLGRCIMALNVTKEQMNLIIQKAMECKGQEDEVILQKLYDYVIHEESFDIRSQVAYVLVSLENFKRFLEDEKKVLDRALAK